MAVRPIFLLLCLGHLLFVFRLASYAFLEFGSFGWIKKKRGKKSQEVREQEAWNPSIIAVEPGNSKTCTPNQHKLNMAENLMVNVVIKSKQDMPTKPLCLEMLLPFFRLKGSVKVKKGLTTSFLFFCKINTKFGSVGIDPKWRKKGMALYKFACKTVIQFPSGFSGLIQLSVGKYVWCSI